jgi:transposase
LRSGRIAWQEGTEKGELWNIHHLILYCAVDTRLWTAEGTEQVRQEKAEDIAKTLTNMNEKGDINDKQQAFIRRKQSTLARLNNPFLRPSKPLYQGQPHILVGVALGLDKPATVAVVDGLAGKEITYRSVKQLLGDNYELLNKQRQLKQRQSHQRHKAQSSGRFNQFGDSQLGEYVDRLLAKAIIAFAQTYHAGSIVLPKLGDMRELVQSEIQARAEQKIPGYLEGQKKYTKQYRVNIHQWSYGRLIDNIKAQAAKLNLVVEEGQQSIR